MLRIVKAECLKMKRTFGGKLPLIAPFIMLLLAFVMTGGLNDAFPSGAWNWWYILFLPGAAAVACCLNIQKDKRIKYYNMLLLGIAPQRCWCGKIIYCALGLAAANLMMLAGTTLGGALLGSSIPIGNAVAGALLLTVCYLWLIPLLLFLSARFGMFVSVLTGIILAVASTVALADSALWWICPASVPIRLMCPVLGILPNGLPVPAGSELLDTGVILPGVAIAAAWFAALTAATAAWFARREDRT